MSRCLAPLHQGVPEEYVALLKHVYAQQTGFPHCSKTLAIHPVKHGDVLSPLIVNAGLEKAKGECVHKGWTYFFPQCSKAG